MYDFLIVGAGLFGATAARRLTEAGRSCLVIDKRSHVGGNCYTETRNGIIVHVYGPHYFHTNNERVWSWVNRFGSWKTYVPRVKAKVDGRVFSFPVNLMTLHQLWGVSTPEEAKAVLEEKQEHVSGTDAESHLLRSVGRELYELFYRGYTSKQWNEDPKNLPSSIVSRLPVRLTYDDSYHHSSKYQALPVEGYTPVIEALLEGSQVELATDFSTLRGKVAKNTIYTGSLDTLYTGERLPYRSLRFDHELLPLEYFQGCAQVNYPGLDTKYTRIIEHKHLHGGGQNETIVTWEYPSDEGEPYYPILNPNNIELARRYRAQAEADGLLVGGRLGTYRYMDMDGAVASALQLMDKVLG